MIDLKSIAEAITGIAAIIAAIKAWRANGAATDAKEELEQVKIQMNSILVHIQSVQQAQANAQNVNVNIAVTGAQATLPLTQQPPLQGAVPPPQLENAEEE